jgi:hypothetical protein
MGRQQLRFRTSRRFLLDRFAQFVDHRIESIEQLKSPCRRRLIVSEALSGPGWT